MRNKYLKTVGCGECYEPHRLRLMIVLFASLFPTSILGQQLTLHCQVGYEIDRTPKNSTSLCSYIPGDQKILSVLIDASKEKITIENTVLTQLKISDTEYRAKNDQGSHIRIDRISGQIRYLENFESAGCYWTVAHLGGCEPASKPKF